MVFRDLASQYLKNKESIDEAILKVISSSEYILGKPVFELESKLAEFVGRKYCISCANGTDALQLALMAWEIGPGDAVFVPDFTFFSTAEVVSLVGATPIFVDVDINTYNLSTISLKNAIEYIKENTDLVPKVVIAVDLFGQPADYLSIESIARENGLFLLEDGAQGFGGSIGERKACSFGDISTTSFFPAKPLGCYGDGGAIFTDNFEWAELIKSYRVHGKGEDKYDNIRIGINSRLDTIQAAVLLEKMKFFSDEIVMCQRVANWYSEELSKNPHIIVPVVNETFESSWAQYTIRFESGYIRDAVQKALKEHNIPSMIYYRKPLHMQRAFVDKGIEFEYSNSIQISMSCLSLPMSAYVKKEQVVKISEVIDFELSKMLS